ncbi:structural maintenance of chromosome (SMC) family protein [Perkinsela sp. CCAP 1560/4]|nr:structural maintenance of chromosome (SMC) family protein [Perkinsela sp. CCAP 1560/4]|eukprot:KNH01738.1 structural maintenance of chromosome (SMC) family protein [Perkinsela sp. CCAP 1560/4]
MQSASLVQINLENFKSYVGKHVIGPFSSFSCVIGPNGSGKSNFTDAIGFVLGVDFSFMRVASYRDFISHGCESTTVTLTLNLAGNTHTITKTVDLKDDKESIHILHNDSEKTQAELIEFLVRCNIHVDLKNFLIFQHEVEAITQKKSTELTAMIEKISGSGESKAEYDEIRAKLEAISKKISAVAGEKKDITGEINRCKSQKKEYDRYRDLLVKEKKANALKNLFILLLNECELIEKKEALARSQREIDEFEKSYIEQTKNMKEKKVAFAEIHKKHLLAMKTVRDETCHYRDANASYEKMRTTIEQLNKQKTRLLGETSIENKFLGAINETISSLKQSIAHKEAEKERLEAAWRVEDEEAEQSRLSPAHLEEYRTIRKEVGCETVLLRQKIDSMRKTGSIVEDSVRRDEILLEDTDASVRATNEQLSACTERAEGLKLAQSEIRDELRATKELYDSNRASFQHSAETQTDKKTELQQIDAQLDLMQYNKEESSREKKNSEALTAMKALTRGVRGRLVDLCTVPNEKYRIAATVALGKYMNAIVVETQTHALECVRYLKENRVGVMEFIPLDSAKGKHVDERCRSFGGTCRPLVDIFKYDAWLEPAVRYALGQTLVCDTIEEAKKIAFNSLGTKYAVVTIDGSVILKNGALQGGLQSVRDKAKKWDERKYAELKEKKSRLQLELFEASGASDTAKVGELERAKQKLDSLRTRSESTDAEIVALKDKAEHMRDEIAVLEESRSKTARRIDQRKASLAELEKNIHEIQQKIRSMEVKAFSKLQKKVGKQDILQWEERRSEKTSLQAEKRQQFILQLAALKNKLALETEKHDLRLASTSEKQIDEISRKIASLEAEVTSKKSQVDKMLHDMNTANTELEVVRKQLSTIEGEIRKFAVNNSDNGGAIAAARKLASSYTMSCGKLRAERFNIFLRGILENSVLPYVLSDGEPHENERKRHRRARTDVSSESTSQESIRAMKLSIRRSEPFDVSENPLIRSAVLEDVSSQSLPTFVCIDFGSVPEKQRQATVNGDQAAELATLERAEIHIREEISALEPHVMVNDSSSKVEDKLSTLNTALDKLKTEYRSTTDSFHRVKETRYSKFQHTFELVNESVGKIYKALTEGTRGSVVAHGSAYLTLDNQEEPYLYGTKYHATPPLKRFMGMEALSGGERTMAALSLLFALHTVRPAPFIVLDEVDAALDLTNVQKLAQYFRGHSSICQFLVVSLNPDLFSMSDSLFGVYKDKARESSALLSIDLTQFQE